MGSSRHSAWRRAISIPSIGAVIGNGPASLLHPVSAFLGPLRSLTFPHSGQGWLRILQDAMECRASPWLAILCLYPAVLPSLHAPLLWLQNKQNLIILCKPSQLSLCRVCFPPLPPPGFEHVLPPLLCMEPGFALASPSAVIDVSSFRKCSIPFISESRTVPGPMVWWFSQSGSSENAEWINEWMHTFKWTKITSIMFPFKNIYLFWIVFEKDPWGLEIETGNFGNYFFFLSPFCFFKL